MKRTGFKPLTVRKPTTLETVATVLYLIGCLGMDPSVPRPAVIPVIVAEVTAYAVAFFVVPPMLHRYASRKIAERG